MRTSLLPGLLKTIRENRSHALPMKIFETSDVVFKDRKRERQARNVRHAAAVWCNKTAGFEVIHGLLDRAMQMLEVPKIASTDKKAPTGYYIKERSGQCSSILRGHSGHNGCLRLTLLLPHTTSHTSSDPTFFPGRAASIYYRAPLKNSEQHHVGSTLEHIKDDIKSALHPLHHHHASDVEIGKLGILHPEVLEKFEIGYPCSALEFTLEPFKKKMSAMWTNDE